MPWKDARELPRVPSAVPRVAVAVDRLVQAYLERGIVRVRRVAVDLDGGDGTLHDGLDELHDILRLYLVRPDDRCVSCGDVRT